MKKITILLVIISTLLITSCNKIKDLEYRGVTSSKVKKAGVNNTAIQLDVKFFNPNSFSVDVKDAVLDVYLDDDKVGTADLYIEDGPTRSILIPKNEEFILPIIANINPFKAIGSGLKMLTSSTINLGVKGTAKVGKAGVFIKVPIDVKEKINIRDLR
jgi:LEA14-like dessication related protein